LLPLCLVATMLNLLLLPGLGYNFASY
jgi:hypothetical protein